MDDRDRVNNRTDKNRIDNSRTTDTIRTNEPLNTRSENLRNDNKHLFRLGELDDYKVASDNPDVRGWDLLDRDNQKVGTVNELIVDLDRRKVRYLDVNPGNDTFRGDSEHRLLIPIGVARIDDSNNNVIVNELDRDRLNSFPPHSGGAITRDYENEVVSRFNSTNVDRTETRDDRADFYDNQLYNEENFYNKRDRNRKL